MQRLDSKGQKPPHLAVWGFCVLFGVPKVYLREKRTFLRKKGLKANMMN